MLSRNEYFRHITLLPISIAIMAGLYILAAESGLGYRLEGGRGWVEADSWNAALGFAVICAFWAILVPAAFLFVSGIMNLALSYGYDPRARDFFAWDRERGTGTVGCIIVTSMLCLVPITIMGAYGYRGTPTAPALIACFFAMASLIMALVTQIAAASTLITPIKAMLMIGCRITASGPYSPSYGRE